MCSRSLYQGSSTCLDMLNAAREKWCKVAFQVEVSDDLDGSVCKCGTYEHSGLLCCHLKMTN
jgi:hypothetical protein